jgi:hypothetical protein
MSVPGPSLPRRSSAVVAGLGRKPDIHSEGDPGAQKPEPSTEPTWARGYGQRRAGTAHT